MAGEAKKFQWGLECGGQEIAKAFDAMPASKVGEAARVLLVEAWAFMPPSARLKFLENPSVREQLSIMGVDEEGLAYDFEMDYEACLAYLHNAGLDCFENDEGFFIADKSGIRESDTYPTPQDAVFDYAANFMPVTAAPARPMCPKA